MAKKFVYFARDHATNLIKIGCTNDVNTRIGSFFTGNPRLEFIRVLEVEDANRVESYLHESLIDKRDKGEFFAITIEEVDKQISFVQSQLMDLPTDSTIEAVRGMTELDPIRDATNREAELIQQLVAVRAAKAKLEFQEENLQMQLIQSVGKCSGIKNWINFKTQPTTRLDQTRLREEKPEIYEAYVVRSVTRVFRFKPNTKN